MTDLDLLMRAIVAAPDDDTVRLAYADELGAQDTVRVKCRNCGPVRALMPGFDVEMACAVCDGTGEVVCTANRDRAEFVRVQVELERHPHGHHVRTKCYDARDGMDVNWTHAFRLHVRESALLAANPAWRPECPQCFSIGHKRARQVNTRCGSCGGAGYMRLAGIPSATPPSPDGFEVTMDDPPPPVPTCAFRRGFAEAVTVPTLATCFHGGVLTRWARDVFSGSRFETVEQIVVSDREPESVGYGFGWRDEGVGNGPENLPAVVFLEPTVRLIHSTPQEANAVMFYAVARVVKRLAKLI